MTSKSLAEVLIDFDGTNYELYRDAVLLWDQTCEMHQDKRPGLLMLKLKGQIREYMMRKRDYIMQDAKAWWDWTVEPNSPGVISFIWYMDYECRKDHAEIEFKDIMDFLRIKRHESSLTAFLQRFNMAKEKCMSHHGGGVPCFRTGSSPH